MQIRGSATYRPLEVTEEEFRANIERDPGSSAAHSWIVGGRGQRQAVGGAKSIARSRTPTMTVNMGRSTSARGVLRLVLELDDKVVQSVMPTIGYLRTGIEKTAEQRKMANVIRFVERMDYLAARWNSLAYALGVEKMLGLEMPSSSAAASCR